MYMPLQALIGPSGGPPTGTPESVINSHTAPAGAITYDDFQVWINDVPVPVYRQWYNGTHVFVRGADQTKSPCGFAQCDGTAGVARVRVTVSNRGTITSAKVIPKRRAITPTISGNTITFTLPVEGAYTPGVHGHWRLEVNGSRDNWLDITINPPADPAPVAGAPGVHYYTPGTITRHATATTHAFGPGIYHVGGTGASERRFQIKNNDVIYLAPGAIVYGFFAPSHASGAANRLASVRMYGRGTIDGTYNPDTRGAVRIYNCADVYMEGITIAEAHGWSNKQFHNQKVRVVGVKVYGSRVWNNGLSICSSKNVEASHLRINVNDDGIEMKSFGDSDDVSGDLSSWFSTPRRYTDAENNVENIHLHSSFVRADVGIGVIVIGYEVGCHEIRNVLVEDLDTYNSYHRSLFSCDVKANEGMPHPHVHDITFRRVYAEDHSGASTGARWHWYLTPKQGESSATTATSKITDVRFQDWHITGTMAQSQLYAYSATNNIDGVVFSNIHYNGEKQTSLSGLKITQINSQYIKNITVE